MFVKNNHGHHTRNNHNSVKLLKVRTEFGRKSFNFMAAGNYNELPLSARKHESGVLFRQFLDEHL
jgi:hypothetical protein